MSSPSSISSWHSATDELLPSDPFSVDSLASFHDESDETTELPDINTLGNGAPRRQAASLSFPRAGKPAQTAYPHMTYPTSASPLASDTKQDLADKQLHLTLTPTQKALFDSCMTNALGSGRGIFQFVSPAAHNSHPSTDFPISLYLQKVGVGGSFSIDGKNYTIEKIRETTPSLMVGPNERLDDRKAKQWQVTLETNADDDTLRTITIPITQIGMSYARNYFDAGELAYVRKVYDLHQQAIRNLAPNRQGAQTSEPQQTAPATIRHANIISFRGIGRNAALITLLEAEKQLSQLSENQIQPGMGAANSVNQTESADTQVDTCVDAIVQQARQDREGFLQNGRGEQERHVRSYLKQLHTSRPQGQAALSSPLAPVPNQAEKQASVRFQPPTTPPAAQAITTAAPIALTPAPTNVNSQPSIANKIATPIAPKGLHNPNNLCYFNASLQFIIHVFGGQRLSEVSQLKDFLTSYLDHNSPSKPIEPTIIQGLHEKLWSFMPSIHNSPTDTTVSTDQQDALAACMDLINSLLPDLEIGQAQWRTRLTKSTDRTINRLADVNEAEKKQLVPELARVCIQKNREKESLQGIMDSFLQTQKLDTPTEGDSCTHKKTQPIILTNQSAPNCLFLPIQAYRREGDQNIKVHTPNLNLNTDIKIPIWNEQDNKEQLHTFKVQALIAHSGVAVDSGHYITAVRQNANVWTILNDKKIDENQDIDHWINTQQFTPVMLYLTHVNQIVSAKQPDPSSATAA